jgi:hypothetical protein
MFLMSASVNWMRSGIKNKAVLAPAAAIAAEITHL